MIHTIPTPPPPFPECPSHPMLWEVLSNLSWPFSALLPKLLIEFFASYWSRSCQEVRIYPLFPKVGNLQQSFETSLLGRDKNIPDTLQVAYLIGLKCKSSGFFGFFTNCLSLPKGMKASPSLIILQLTTIINSSHILRRSIA